MKNVFLTGSTGFLGGELVKRLIQQQPQANLFLLVRNRGKQPATARFAEMLGEWATELKMSTAALEARLHLVEGDLVLPALGIPGEQRRELTEKVDTIFHLAASIDLLGKYEKLHRTNLGGTRSILEFAAETNAAGGLNRLHYVSTAYVSGQRRGRVLENELEKGQSFSNDYERVKWQAEKEVQAAKTTLPITIYRPSIVIGDSRTGYAPDDCATLDFVKLLVTGKMPFIPGGRRLKCDFVPVDYVADALAHLSTLSDETLGQTFHLVAGKNHCLSSFELAKVGKNVVETMQAQRGNPGSLRLPFKVHPLLAMAGVWLCSRLNSKIPPKLVQFWMTYSRYNWYCKEYDDSNATRLLEKAGIHKPSVRQSLEVTLRRNFDVDLQYTFTPDWSKDARFEFGF